MRYLAVLAVLLVGCEPEPKTPRERAAYDCRTEAIADFQIYQDLDKAQGVWHVCRIHAGLE